MKASKQRKMARAIVSNKALKNIDAQRLTDMQCKVFDNSYKRDRKVWNEINKAFRACKDATC